MRNKSYKLVIIIIFYLFEQISQEQLMKTVLLVGGLMDPKRYT
jgi:hypothetical protein